MKERCLLRTQALEEALNVVKLETIRQHERMTMEMEDQTSKLMNLQSTDKTLDNFLQQETKRFMACGATEEMTQRAADYLKQIQQLSLHVNGLNNQNVQCLQQINELIKNRDALHSKILKYHEQLTKLVQCMNESA